MTGSRTGRGLPSLGDVAQLQARIAALAAKQRAKRPSVPPTSDGAAVRAPNVKPVARRAAATVEMPPFNAAEQRRLDYWAGDF